tara:strand:- start:242 stop:577 length:336 start_codon:yes stop_codon:yes gene_type:complete
MKNQDQTLCDACLNEVAGVLSLNEYAGDLVCDQCMGELNEMIEDHFNDDMTDQEIDDYWRIDRICPPDADELDHGDSSYGDDSWVDHCDGEAELAHWDDDPNPYHGTYSEE